MISLIRAITVLAVRLYNEIPKFRCNLIKSTYVVFYPIMASLS